MDTVQVLSVIGTGTYSDVYAGVVKDSGEEVALKRLKPDHSAASTCTGAGWSSTRRLAGSSPPHFAGLPRAVRNEIKALAALQHPNILALRGVFKHSVHVVLVTERAQCSLAHLLTTLSRPMTETEVSSIMGQALRGLAHAHALGWSHRDLAPGNILLCADGRVVVGDWGQASLSVPAPSQAGRASEASLEGASGPTRRGATDPTGTQHDAVGTRWYKAPEKLFGDTRGSPAGDVWSAGLVLAEVLRQGDPLCPGANDISQLGLVLRTFGTPSPATWEGLTALPDYGKLCFEPFKPVPLHLLLPGVSPTATEAVRGMTQVAPPHRLTASSLLKLPFFQGVSEHDARACVRHLLSEVQGPPAASAPAPAAAGGGIGR